MLKQEEIQKRINSRRRPKVWFEARMDGLAMLDKKSRAIGQLLIGCNEKNGSLLPDDDNRWQLRRRGLQELEALDDRTVVKLGSKLFPQCAQAFEAAWQLHELLPYGTGPAQTPFRAAACPNLLRPRRNAFLAELLLRLDGLDEDPLWLAAHAPHLSVFGGSESIGLLLAAVIDQGGNQADDIQDILRQSAEGRHEIGQMGRHVTTAFLCSRQPGCWEYVEKLLLAAQRQEGVRQAILESAGFSHPNAFRRMLRLIVDHNLTRFSSVVRAADVWLGLLLDSQSSRYIHDVLESVARFLDDDHARDLAIQGDDPEAAYFALWAMAFDDAPSVIAPATRLLDHSKPELRFIGVQGLAMLSICQTYPIIVKATCDSDLRVAMLAAANATEELVRRMMQQAEQESTDRSDLLRAGSLRHVGTPKRLARNTGDLFERLASLYDRLPARPATTKPFIWPWVTISLSRQYVAQAMVLALEHRPVCSVLPYLDVMSPEVRRLVADLIGSLEQLDDEARGALLKLVGDASGEVREAALAAIKKHKLLASDASVVESLLVRKAEGLRRGVIALLLSQDDPDVLASASRLITAKNAGQRLAGLELLQQMYVNQRAIDAVGRLGNAYREEHATLSREERLYLESLQNTQQAAWSLDNALGLMDPSKRTLPTQPRLRGISLGTPAAAKLIALIDKAVHAHREEPVKQGQGYSDPQPQPLGSIEYGFPSVFEYHPDDKVGKRAIDELPLHEVWQDLWLKRPQEARDSDGLEIARAILMCSLVERFSDSRRTGWEWDLVQSEIGKCPRVTYARVTGEILAWLAAYEVPCGFADFIIDAFEHLLASIPFERLLERSPYGSSVFRSFLHNLSALTDTMRRIAAFDGHWTREHTRRMFGLLRWIDDPISEPAPALTKGQTLPERDRPKWKEYVQAFDCGWANEHDVYDALLGPRPEMAFGCRLDELPRASADLRKGRLSPGLAAIVRPAIDRILEIELVRGETATPATEPALALRYAGGLDTLIRVLQAIGRDPKLQRTRTWRDEGKGKSTTFSHLLQCTVPGKEDTPENFAQAVAKAGINEDMLLAVAFFAPQWAHCVERALGWKMLAEAVWWFHAHTKDSNWRVDYDLRESWNAEIRKSTPLTLDDLLEGAVDVEWFNRAYAATGPKKWARFDDYAKFASGGAGHKRAQLFADAMLKKAKKTQLLFEIKVKRKQDAVRALGLLPLDAKNAKKDVLDRYKVMQEFIRDSREFGSQRQASEKLAARIGQENLARTAGYPDPIRLQWAMEALNSADLVDGPVVVKVKDVCVQLAIDAEGRPEVSVCRKDKPLKNIPPDAKSNRAVAMLMERKADLRRSAARMRQSLELAMCRGDVFSGEELLELMGNVVLRPMLQRLVFVGDGIAGYPVDGGKGLRDHASHVEPVRKNEKLRLAHPSDLLVTKAWTQWQRDCFVAERVQPFKQVFRELYVLTQQETQDKTFSRRYAGQQVNPRQALALLGSRGWVTEPESGVFRVFHEQRLVAWIEFMEAFYTPAEVEGLTVEKVSFVHRGTSEAVGLKDVPPRILSETLRDVDLIVSVAHRGGVDPEASASTTQMRAALLRETVRVLRLDNVKVAEPHVHIKGKHAEYSVHLGSATTHMLPGGSLFIVPVHSQHRGRIFLPFADDDPKTAEVLSKVLLLARDEEINDPSILDQIRSRG